MPNRARGAQFFLCFELFHFVVRTAIRRRPRRYFYFVYFMFCQITRLLAGKPALRIDLSKQAKDIVSVTGRVLFDAVTFLTIPLARIIGRGGGCTANEIVGVNNNRVVGRRTNFVRQ